MPLQAITVIKVACLVGVLACTMVQAQGSSSNDGNGKDGKRVVLAESDCTGCARGLCFPASGCAGCYELAGWCPAGNTCRRDCEEPEGAVSQSRRLRVAAQPRVAAPRRVTAPGLSLHAMCSSNSVLARGTTGPVFGNGTPGDLVLVELKRGSTLVKKASTRVRSNGRWIATLGNLKAGSGFTIKATVAARKQMATASNVAVGELWLISGQSNVGITLTDLSHINSISFPPFTQEAKKVLGTATNHPLLHLLKVPKAASSTPQLDLPSGAMWTVNSKATLERYSALGFLAFSELAEQLGIPVGVVQSAYGGTSIVQWIPTEVLPSIKRPATLRSQPKFSHYNAMIAPMKGTAWSGIVWYQGESDAGLKDASPLYDNYAPLLKGLISSWRNTFSQPKLPWEIIQLPIYNSAYRPKFNINDQSGDTQNRNHWPYVREAQREVAKSTSLTSLVSAFDLGLPGRIHPPNKWLLAKRLVQSILRQQTGSSKYAATGPTIKSARADGSSVTVSFDDVGAGLLIAIKQPFTIDPIDRKPSTFNIDCFEVKLGSKWVKGRANLSGKNTVTVNWSSGGRKPSGVRYGWYDFAICNLYSKSELPAVPFKTAVA